jgi:four helix bundle protein
MKERKTHKDLDVWKESIKLVKEMYFLTKQFPSEELYGLTSQMRRAAVSVPSNIAEGAVRNSQKEFIQFLYVALGSIAELETQLILSKELGYLKDSKDYKIDLQIDSIRKMLIGLIKRLEEQK